ncbi:hypothetical protein DMP06_06365 [Slackia equolifaciens]|uniref:Uncharacterized protein n=1 Tax=Slackia equolifaciens TaxID=498718 RepID=A0A3N0AYK5_9ACTN|nr:hypothetical protein [Slackia equolifaciens]RNL39952.1 hypothetical protein DMP06_06365 [Slackia equolifaciens]
MKKTSKMPDSGKAQVRHFRFCTVPAIRMIEVDGRFCRSLVVESQGAIFQVILDGDLLFFCISSHLSAQVKRTMKLYALQVMENGVVPLFAISTDRQMSGMIVSSAIWRSLSSFRSGNNRHRAYLQ